MMIITALEYCYATFLGDQIGVGEGSGKPLPVTVVENPAKHCIQVYSTNVEPQSRFRVASDTSFFSYGVLCVSGTAQISTAFGGLKDLTARYRSLGPSRYNHSRRAGAGFIRRGPCDNVVITFRRVRRVKLGLLTQQGS